jgi:hypothetical protein
LALNKHEKKAGKSKKAARQHTCDGVERLRSSPSMKKLGKRVSIIKTLVAGLTSLMLPAFKKSWLTLARGFPCLSY